MLAGGVANGDFDDLEVQLRGTENQIEISEGIKLAEIGTVGDDLLVVPAAQNLGSAKGVRESLIEQPAEEPRESLVGEQIQESHCLVLHRVDKPRAVDEFSLAGCQGVIELGQRLWRHCQVCIQDHENVAARVGKALM